MPLAICPWYVLPDLHNCHKWMTPFLYFRELCLWQIPRLDEKLNKNTMEEKQKAKLLKAFHWRPKSTRKLCSLSSSSVSTCSSSRVYSEQSDRLCDVKANTWKFSIGMYLMTYTTWAPWAILRGKCSSSKNKNSNFEHTLLENKFMKAIVTTPDSNAPNKPSNLDLKKIDWLMIYLLMHEWVGRTWHLKNFYCPKSLGTSWDAQHVNKICCLVPEIQLFV